MTYQEWIACYDTLTPERVTELRRAIDKLAHPPLISILLPVYNADLAFLDRAIASVQRQIYENWELCIADDASTDARIRPFLEEQADKEKRISLCLRDTNGHISACSNSALELANGDWCALLDQDDELAQNALSEVVCLIAQNADAGIVYSDEDFIDASGERSNPFFKPDWNPELFLGQNYLNHLGVYRTELLRAIGGFREGFEGSQDYDLILRCLARLQSGQIHHVPRILYHWRMVTGSLAQEPDAKPYAREAARRALNSYLERSGIPAQATPCPENAESHRVIYDIPRPFPTVTVLVSDNESPQVLERSSYSPMKLVRSGRGAKAANSAAQEAGDDILVFLSDCSEADELDWLREMVSHARRAGIGAVGARLWSSERLLDDGALILGLGGIAAPAFRGIPRGHPGYFNRAWLQQNCSAVSARCLAIRKDVFSKVDGFDEENFPFHFYAVDLCLRLRRLGLQTVWTPYANLTLRKASPQEEESYLEEAARFKERWSHELDGDPFYNPNLSLELPGFVLANPPRLGARHDQP